jgi:hypothetical protein
MPPADRYDPATVELVAKAVHDYACFGDGCSWSEAALPCDLAEFAGFGVAVLAALTAAGWLAPDQRGTREEADRLIAVIRAQERAKAGEDAARAVEENPGPDPSPAIPAWWSGWVEGRDDAVRIVREVTGATEEGP